jgi:acyl-CoA hydrolase
VTQQVDDAAELDLTRYIGRGPLRADVLFLALPQAGPDGTFGLGLAADYLAPLIGRAGTVIAEVNDQVPDVGGDRRLSRGEIDVLVRTSRPPAEYPGQPASDVDIAIAEPCRQPPGRPAASCPAERPGRPVPG